MSPAKPRFLPHLPADFLAEHQLAGVRWSVQQAMKSPQYRAKLAAAGLPAARTSRRLMMSAVCPFRTWPTCATAIPCPCFAWSPPKSCACTPRRYDRQTQNPRLHPEGRGHVRAPDGRCYELAGLTTEDRMQIAVGYGLWTAGAASSSAASASGRSPSPWAPATSTCSSSFLWICRPPASAAPRQWPSSLPRKWSATICATRSHLRRSFSVPSRTASKCARVSPKNSALRPATTSRA